MVKKKKMLTVEDLYKFCLETNFAKFSAKESGYQLAVQVPTTFEVDDASDDNHRGMMRLKFRILHDGKNRNGSFVSHKSAVKASNTIADRPIMAAIHQLDDGSWDFKSHEMEIIENDEGEYEINYIEKQVGSFSSEKPFWEHDDKLDKDYLCAYGYIAEEYTKAADIIRNKGWTKNSCELVIEEMSFNAKEKQLELNEFYLSASTLLGREDDGTEIGEGMLGSRADIADFSVENNSVFSQNKQVIEMLSALSEKIDNLNINEKLRKEEKDLDMKEEFEEITEEITEEEIVDSPSEEVFEDSPKKKKKDEEDDVTVIVDENEVVDEIEPEDNETDDDDTETDSEDENEESFTNDTGYYSIDYSVQINGEKKDFSVSLKEKLNALTTLVNETYGEADGAWYDVDVIEETKTVEFHDWWANKHYRQSYSVKKDSYSLKGDRTETFVSFLSADEKSQLEQMKSNYSSIESKLEKYESEPKKKEILQSTDWDNIRETTEFAELSKEENHFDLTIDELSTTLNNMLLEFSKGHKIEFSTNESEKKPVGMKLFGNPSKKVTKRDERYGGIFSN